MEEITANEFVEITTKEFVDLIRNAIDLGNSSEVDSAITFFSSFCFENKEEPEFPSDVFDAIIEQMGNKDFHSLPDSNCLLSLFESDWGRLGDHQKSTLLEAIENSFTFYKDDQSCFILAEVLGVNYADSRSSQVLNNLIKTKDERIRAYVTYGFGQLARNTNEKDVQKNAVAILINIAINDAGDAGDEARDALDKLVNEQKNLHDEVLRSINKGQSV